MKEIVYFICAVILAVGISIAGYFVQHGMVNFRASARNVEVKGLAERNVEADMAVWTISYNVSDEDLQIAQQRLNASEKIMRSFLAEYGLKDENIKIDRLSVYQRQEQDRKIGDITNYKNIYNINQNLSVRSDNVRTIEKAAQNTAKLLEQGIIIQDSRPRYMFTRLNEIKPDMIAEATRNAREAALRFAKDSGSEVGSILRAAQGWFNILPRDGGEYGEEDYIEKKVRVITTIDFMLVD